VAGRHSKRPATAPAHIVRLWACASSSLLEEHLRYRAFANDMDKALKASSDCGLRRNAVWDLSLINWDQVRIICTQVYSCFTDELSTA
jgi:hypothetical protein